MTSQLELRLQRSIDQDTDLVLRATSKAKLACYLARIGEFDRAEELRLDLRATFADGKFPRISILLMLLDGLLIYYRNLGSGARDRIARANLISATFGIHDLTSLTSAWLAHLAFNRCDYDGMIAETRRCLDCISHDDDSARIRISLVLGDAFLYSNQSVPSRSWYENARLGAVRQGDQAAIGALTYNRAALNIHNLQIREITSTPVLEDFAYAKTELQTAVSYQSLARIKSLDHLLIAAQVGLDVVRGDYVVADKPATTLLEMNCFRENSGDYSVLLANLAVSRAKIGDLDSSESFLQKALSLDTKELNADDRAIFYFSLSKLASVLDDKSGRELYISLALSSLKEHEQNTQRLRELLVEFIDVRG